MKELIPQLTTKIHCLLEQFVQFGDVVIDATMGMGNDTCFLAQLVGNNGKVYSFDIQQEACEATHKLVTAKQLAQQVVIINSGHENMLLYVKEPVTAIVFNLGYLPGGNHQITTTGRTSLKAVEDGLSLIEKEGIMLIAAYIGHPGGLEEHDVLERFLLNLPVTSWIVGKEVMLNRTNAPVLFLVQKK